MVRFGIAFWILSLAFSAYAAAEERVYMLGKVRLTGTTYTSTVFFYAPEVTSLAMCEKEKRGGHYGRWKHYGHYIRKTAGLFAKRVDYLCVSTPTVFKKWHDRNTYDYVYLVDMREGRFEVKEFPSYLKCLGELRETQKQESRFYYCSKSNQAIVD